MNPKVCKGIMKSMIPFRFSVEFECFGGYLNVSNKKTILSVSSNIDSFTPIRLEVYRESVNEIRISCLAYHQLEAFYQRLEHMKMYNKGGNGTGIHIHIDISSFDYASYSRIKMRKAVQLFDSVEVLDKVYQIFGSKYQGAYNKRGARTQSKGWWINCFRDFDTIEFRIGDLTFEYEELIKIIIELEKLVKHIMLQSGFKLTRKVYNKADYEEQVKY